MQALAPEHRIQVWDLPTRLFHWTLVALVLVAWVTGEEEGVAALVHRLSGAGAAGLLAFRVVWGFVGGERARFSDFAAGPNAIVVHVRDLFSRQPKRHLGHNPLGGLAVFLLLATIAAVIVTGLFSGGDHASGPFAGAWGVNLAELHEMLFRVLQALVIIHVLGVVIESVRSKDALVPAMITGSKRRRPEEGGADAKAASATALILALSVGAAVTLATIAAPPLGARVNVTAEVSGSPQEDAEDD
ncbi:MAG: cytochrome b/b6 domain-containing protein [Hyphomonadaceae bacterium]